MSRRLLCLLLLAGLAAAVPAAAEPTPARFACGMPVTVSGDSPFYEMELPLAVYRGSVRSDLGDLRVFNAAGRIVPHALRRPGNRTLREEVTASELPFFPLPQGAGQAAGDLAVHVERDAAGRDAFVGAFPGQ